MTLITTVDAAGNERVKMTECPYCQESMDTETPFGAHWPQCPANPAVSNKPHESHGERANGAEADAVTRHGQSVTRTASPASHDDEQRDSHTTEH